ncbi:MAG: hypothetical protein Q8O89_03245 [Nanoarchaeota archaeon]|nr:hypothetical protein [Nanoarchaeota archaeon]
MNNNNSMDKLMNNLMNDPISMVLLDYMISGHVIKQSDSRKHIVLEESDAIRYALTNTAFDKGDIVQDEKGRHHQAYPTLEFLNTISKIYKKNGNRFNKGWNIDGKNLDSFVGYCENLLQNSIEDFFSGHSVSNSIASSRRLMHAKVLYSAVLSYVYAKDLQNESPFREQIDVLYRDLTSINTTLMMTRMNGTDKALENPVALSANLGQIYRATQSYLQQCEAAKKNGKNIQNNKNTETHHHQTGYDTSSETDNKTEYQTNAGNSSVNGAQNGLKEMVMTELKDFLAQPENNSDASESQLLMQLAKTPLKKGSFNQTDFNQTDSPVLSTTLYHLDAARENRENQDKTRSA